jgi:hypothetical protein
MSNQARAVAWVTLYLARRNYVTVSGQREDVQDRFRGFGLTQQSALDDAITSGRTSSVTLTDVEHGCMTTFYSTPYGIVMLDG